MRIVRQSGSGAAPIPRSDCALPCASHSKRNNRPSIGGSMLRLGLASVRRALAVVIVGMVAIGVGGQLVKRYLGHKNLFGIIPLFDLDTEANVPAWYQSMTLGVCGALLAYIALHASSERKPFARHWGLLSALFFFLSADEIGSIHERLADMLKATRGLHFTGVFYYAWVLPYAALLVGLAVAFLPFVRHLPSGTRIRFLLSGSVYVAGALGMEMVGGYHVSRYGTETLTYLAMTSVEETLEMCGVACFMVALLRTIQANQGEVRIGIRLDQATTAHREMPRTLRSIPVSGSGGE